MSLSTLLRFLDKLPVTDADLDEVDRIGFTRLLAWQDTLPVAWASESGACRECRDALQAVTA